MFINYLCILLGSIYEMLLILIYSLLFQGKFFYFQNSQQEYEGLLDKGTLVLYERWYMHSSQNEVNIQKKGKTPILTRQICVR